MTYTDCTLAWFRRTDPSSNKSSAQDLGTSDGRGATGRTGGAHYSAELASLP